MGGATYIYVWVTLVCQWVCVQFWRQFLKFPPEFYVPDLTTEVAVPHPDEERATGACQWHLLDFSRQRLEEGQSKGKTRHSTYKRPGVGNYRRYVVSWSMQRVCVEEWK